MFDVFVNIEYPLPRQDIEALQARQLFHQAGYGGELRPQPERIARKVRHMLAATERVSA